MQLDLPITQIYIPTIPLLLLMLCDINSENCFLPKYRMLLFKFVGYTRSFKVSHLYNRSTRKC